MKKKLTLVVLALALIPFADAFAQKFNPRVEVTNAYEGKVIEAQKEDVKMVVPDSLMRFQYKLDYSVFENPYKGSYDFQPYSIEMRPDMSQSRRKSLFVSAGAGYQLHPELDLVYTPEFRNKNLSLSVYDTFRGFYGNYSCFVNHGDIVFSLGKAGLHERGYVFDNRAGVTFKKDFGKLYLSADASHHLIAAQDTLPVHVFHEGVLALSLNPLNKDAAEYFYGANLSVKTGFDDFTFPSSSYESYRHKVGVYDVAFDASFGSVKGKSSGVVVDLGLQTLFNTGLLDANTTMVWVAPHYQFNWKFGYLSLGVKGSYLAAAKYSQDGQTVPPYSHKSRYVYPDIKARFNVVSGKFAVFADVTGGDYINTYSNLLSVNPFLSPYDVLGGMDNSSEQVNALVGFDGNIAGNLYYNISAGYVDYVNGRLDAIRLFPGEKGELFTYADFRYHDYKMAHADLSLIWKSDRLDIDGRLTYRYTDLAKRNAVCVRPSTLEGSMSFTYNWQRRVYAGLSLRGVTAREGFYKPFIMVKVPGYVDLGLNARYVINSKWSAWIKGGNLLGQQVQYYFLHPEASPYFTLGVSFNI